MHCGVDQRTTRKLFHTQRILRVVLPVAVAAHGREAPFVQFVFDDPLQELAPFVAEPLVVRVIVDLVTVVWTDERRR